MQVATQARNGRKAKLGSPEMQPQKKPWLLLAMDYGPVVALLLLSVGLGMVSAPLGRGLFVVGCLVVARHAYNSRGLGLHAEVSVTLFMLAPFIRRLIDLHGGYDPSGMLLVGPLIALLAVFPELRILLSKKFRNISALVPLLIIVACLVYGWSSSALQGRFLPAMIALAKYVIPILYGICLMLRPDESDNVMRSLGRVFLILIPLTGLYGIWQYLSPQDWDAYWVISSKMLAVGVPAPRMIRVFSTMNSPASYAYFAMFGLMVVSFSRELPLPRTLALIALLPGCISLLLSSVRSSWISLFVALVTCMFFGRTRRQAGLLMAGLGLTVLVILAYTSFGGTIQARLDTLGGNFAQDGSGSERLHDYSYVFLVSTQYLFGTGLAMDNDPRLNATDGELLLSVVQMGIVFGMVHTLAVMWAGMRAVLQAGRSVPRVVAGSLIMGLMSSVLLLSFSIGEFGFLFWMMVGVLSGSQRADLAVRR